MVSESRRYIFGCFDALPRNSICWINIHQLILLKNSNTSNTCPGCLVVECHASNLKVSSSNPAKFPWVLTHYIGYNSQKIKDDICLTFYHLFILSALYNTFRQSVQVSAKWQGWINAGRCVSGTIYLGDQVSQNICTGTHRFGTSRHPTIWILWKRLKESAQMDERGLVEAILPALQEKDLV